MWCCGFPAAHEAENFATFFLFKAVLEYREIKNCTWFRMENTRPTFSFSEENDDVGGRSVVHDFLWMISFFFFFAYASIHFWAYICAFFAGCERGILCGEDFFPHTCDLNGRCYYYYSLFFLEEKAFFRYLWTLESWKCEFGGLITVFGIECNANSSSCFFCCISC